MSNFSKLHLTHEIFRIFTCVFTILAKFDVHFPGLPWDNFLGLITDDLYYYVGNYCNLIGLEQWYFSLL